jgi:opacity protein-like surface antigen
MKKLLVAALALLLSPFALAAAPSTTTPQDNHFSWNYAELGMATHDYDGDSDNVTSLDGDLSYALNQHLYVLGGLDYGWVHSIHLYDLHGGLGFHTPLMKNLDAFGEGELNLTRTESHGDHDNENGYTLRAGVRARVNEMVELKGGIYHVDIDDTDTGLFGSALYHINKQVDAGVRLTLGDHETAFGLFGRYNF